MSTTKQDHALRKRKQGRRNSLQDVERSKKPRAEESQQPAPAPQNHYLIAPHQAILDELRPKYDVLAASVISSTQIRKRVTYAVTHLDKSSVPPPVVLLHARTADVCKLITVVEQCKRVLGDEGKSWYQYNQLFELPKEMLERKDVIEETVLEREGEDSDGDDFETMASRFEKAVMPAAPARAIRSMRVFISLVPVPELRSKISVTVQSSEAPK